MLVVSNLPRDPRVEREARTLAANGFRVVVICPEWTPPTPIDWGPRIAIRKLPTDAANFLYKFPRLFGHSLYEAALAEDAWAYHAHDLNTALPALRAAAHKGVPCVCDFHEWFSENISFHVRTGTFRPHGFLTRWVYRRAEAVVMRSATAVITVCESIANRLERRYDSRQPVHVIRNIPRLDLASKSDAKPTDLRALLGIAANTKIVLYQGGLGPSRNLEPVIRAMALVDGAVLVLRGPGIETYASEYLRLAENSGSAGKVFCLPPVPSSEVVPEARAADFGVWTLLSNVGLNFKLALPNKVFEYLAAGLPLVAADLPEVRRIIDTFQVGLCFDPEDPSSIAHAVRRLVEDEAFFRRCRDNIPRALSELRADEEWMKLVRIYRRFEEPSLTTGRTREASECAA
jgi:glycosyltransferase involved in cell wall biosynthesis